MTKTSTKKTIETPECPACSATEGTDCVYKGRTFYGVYECGSCGALHGQCYLGESYTLVNPHFDQSEITPGDERYFDFVTVGSEGVRRRHGWFNPNTRLITQVG